MTEPHVFTHEKYTVCLFGPERPRTRILPVIYRGNRNKVCLVKAASDSTHPGFMQIKPPVYGSSESNDFDEYADSIVIEESGSSVIMQTADCLTGVLFEHTTKRGVIIHCGKFALMPQNEFGKPIDNIVTRAYRALTKGVTKPSVEAYLTGGICPKCFLHDDYNGQEFVKPFDQFGSHAFLNRQEGTLNLKAIVIEQLRGFGVRLQNIRHDGLCTYEESHLASHRRDGSPKRNAVMFVLH